MKQAIIIMMHKNIGQLKRLDQYFPANRCVCFIHADKKLDMGTAVIQERLGIVLSQRIFGQLANWSLANKSVKLIKYAYEY